MHRMTVRLPVAVIVGTSVGGTMAALLSVGAYNASDLAEPTVVRQYAVGSTLGGYVCRVPAGPLTV